MAVQLLHRNFATVVRQGWLVHGYKAVDKSVDAFKRLKNKYKHSDLILYILFISNYLKRIKERWGRVRREPRTRCSRCPRSIEPTRKNWTL